ncbi:MAG: class I lanthipeptide [Bacteroidales bacterium]
MKEEKPKLALNKRTVARLNNLEMRYVRGGEGGADDTGQTRTECGDPDIVDPTIAVKEVTRSIMSLIVKVC